VEKARKCRTDNREFAGTDDTDIIERRDSSVTAVTLKCVFQKFVARASFRQLGERLDQPGLASMYYVPRIANQ
jgi:hypothetical protein